jgi:competence protein ComEC
MHRVLLLATLSFFVGVLWRSVADVDFYTIGALLVVGLFIALIGVIRSFHATLPVLIICCAMSLGIVRTEFAHRSFSDGLTLFEESVFMGEGEVIQEPDVRDEHTNLTVAVEPYPGKRTVLLVRTPHTPEFFYGARVYVRGTIRKPEAFTTETGRVFAYDGYLMKDGIHYELQRASVEPRDGRGGSSIIRVLLEAKTAWLDAVSRIIPEPSASLLGGVVVGAKRSLGETWLDAFRDTGIIHIVVLSGYNLTLVALFIVWLTKPFSRKVRLALGLAGIAGFALMTGAGATVVRASVMAGLALLAQFLARPYAILRALILAAFLMVLINPFLLLFDPGFQLSFVATLGLVLGTPLIEKYLTYIPEIVGLRSIVSATLATQCAVLPLLIYNIGEVSLVAPLVNVLVLPVVPFVMAVGFSAGILGIIFTPLAAPFAFLTQGILAYVFLIVSWFTTLPFASVHIPPMPVWIIPVLYGIASLYLYRIYKKQSPATERAM